jgi:hypothetical protein
MTNKELKAILERYPENVTIWKRNPTYNRESSDVHKLKEFISLEYADIGIVISSTDSPTSHFCTRVQESSYIPAAIHTSALIFNCDSTYGEDND